MHYKNGREARDGDPVIAKTWNGQIIAGVLHSICPGAQTCNGQIAYPILGGCGALSVTIGEIFHAEDALKALEPAPVAVVAGEVPLPAASAS